MESRLETAASRNASRCRTLILDDRPDLYLDALRRRFPEVLFEPCSDARDLDEAIARCPPQVVFSCKCPGLPHEVHRRTLASSELRWLQVAGVGFEHLQPVTRDDIILTNCAGVLSDFMAETVLGAMLTLNVGFPRYMDQQREHVWQQNAWRGLAGRTALVIGLGAIGRRVARHARHLGMHVLGLRARAGDVEEVHEMIPPHGLHEALGRADVVCVHVPLTDVTRGLLDRSAFDHMKQGALLVNTSRGGVMDEDALLVAMRSGTVAAAYLDVFATEPLPVDSPLWDIPGLVLTPHISDTVSDYRERFAAFFADNLERWLKGEALHNVVDPARGY